LILAIFCPIFIICQSRGEEYRGAPTPVNGYFDRRQQQYQSQQSYNNPQNPNQYYSSQSQSQSYPNYQTQQHVHTAYSPEYYDKNVYQTQHTQPNVQQNYQPAAFPPPPPVLPAYNSRPPVSPPKKVYQQQSQSLDSRFGPDQQSATTEDFTTRRTGLTKRPVQTTRRPPSFDVNQRFDSRDDEIKKKLSFNQALSGNMEIFSLELLQHFNLRLEDENFMISPFSIYHLLVLLAEGANGNTYEQINKRLGLIDLPKTRDFQQYLNVALK
jgi:hypothetical protein